MPPTSNEVFCSAKQILGQIGQLVMVVQMHKSFELHGVSPLTPNQGLCPWRLLGTRPKTLVMGSPCGPSNSDSESVSGQRGTHYQLQYV